MTFFWIHEKLKDIVLTIFWSFSWIKTIIIRSHRSCTSALDRGLIKGCNIPWSSPYQEHPLIKSLSRADVQLRLELHNNSINFCGYLDSNLMTPKFAGFTVAEIGDNIPWSSPYQEQMCSSGWHPLIESLSRADVQLWLELCVVGNFFSNLGVGKLFCFFFVNFSCWNDFLSYVSYLWMAQQNNLPIWNWKLRLFEEFGFFRLSRHEQSWRETPVPSPKPYVKKFCLSSAGFSEPFQKWPSP